MRFLAFAIAVYFISAYAIAGPNDKWVYVGESNPALNIIPLLLAVGAFVWVYVIYKDLKIKQKRRKRR